MIHIFFVLFWKVQFYLCTSRVCFFGNREAEYTVNNNTYNTHNPLTSGFFCLCVSFCVMKLRMDGHDVLRLHFLGYQGDG